MSDWKPLMVDVKCTLDETVQESLQSVQSE